jgi:putative two-component system response regulator
MTMPAHGSRASNRILVVDDDEQGRRMLGRMVEREGYEWVPAGNAAEAHAHLAQTEFALVLSDVNMPGESGLKLLRHVLAEHPDTAAVMVTGVDDSELAKVALELGAYGYVTKPFTRNQILIAVVNALRRRSLEIENRAHREGLEQLVAARTAALERSALQLELTREETVRRLALAIEYRDEDTSAHTERMSSYCALLGRLAGLDSEALRVASPLHDVGKVAIADSILLKPGPLTPEERRQMEQHAEVGYRILTGSGSPMLELAATIARTHHERYDGSGYPHGLSGELIPVEGRIAAVADVFDALTSHRVYRPAFPVEKAIEIMLDGRGSHFDPELLDCFLNARSELLEIMHSLFEPRTQ